MQVQSIITKITKDDQANVISVLFTDGATFKTQKDIRMEVFTLKAFKDLVNKMASSFVSPEDPSIVLSVGPFDPSPTPKDPTPEELARQKFGADLFTRKQMEKAIALGLMDAGDKSYTDQVALVKSEWLPEYLSSL